MQLTKIDWTEAVWNPVTGCTPVSEGCAHCYARRMAQRLRGRAGYPADEPFRVTLHPDRLDQPLKRRKPCTIFVCSMSDLFHEDVPDDFLDEAFITMVACPQHRFLVLTKRAKRMAKHLKGQLYHNVWLGVTAENQSRADERMPCLMELAVAGWRSYVSYEPALGPVDFTPFLGKGLRCAECRRITHRDDNDVLGAAAGHVFCPRCGRESESERIGGLCAIIAGGEAGPGARPADPDWFRRVRDDCEAADVPFFLKSLGAGKGRVLDGRMHDDLAWGKEGP